MDLLTCRYPWPSSLAGVYGPANQQAEVVNSQTRTICPVPKAPKVLQVDGFNGFNGFSSGGIVKFGRLLAAFAFAPAASASCWVRLWAFGAQRTASENWWFGCCDCQLFCHIDILSYWLSYCHSDCHDLSMYKINFRFPLPFFSFNAVRQRKVAVIFFASLMLCERCESALEVPQDFRLLHSNLRGQNDSSQNQGGQGCEIPGSWPFSLSGLKVSSRHQDFNLGLSLSQSQSALLILSIWNCNKHFRASCFALRAQSQDCNPLQLETRNCFFHHSQGDWNRGKKLHEERSQFVRIERQEHYRVAPDTFVHWPGAGHPKWRLSAGETWWDLMGFTPVLCRCPLMFEAVDLTNSLMFWGVFLWGF